MKLINTNTNYTKKATNCIFLLYLLIFSLTVYSQDSTWTIVPAPVENGWLDDLHFIDSDTGWVIGGYDNPSESYIARTNNEGNEWTIQLTTGELLYAVHSSDENNAYAVGKAVFKTSNGGGSWTGQQVFQSVHQYANDVFCLNSNTAFLAGRDDYAQSCLIMHTLDGTNWTKPSYPSVNGRLNSIYFADDNYGWAVGISIVDNKPLVLYTSDGGTNWVQQDQPFGNGQLIRIFAFDHLNAWAVGGTGYTSGDNCLLMVTQDGGINWTATNPPPGTMATSLYMFSDSSAMIATQTNAGGWQADLYYTEDAGATWEPKLQQLAGTFLENVSIIPATTRSGAQAYGAGSDNSGSTIVKANVGIDSVEQQLATINITPQNVGLQVGEQQLFTAQGYDENGQPMNPPITPNWSTTGGTITQQGEYTAPDEPGDYTITAHVEGSIVTGTANVNVISVEELAYIIISPLIVNLPTGESQDFIAAGFDADSNAFSEPINPEWLADGGTISQEGKFTAPDIEANITITARCESGKDFITGNAKVKVRKPGTLLKLVTEPDTISLAKGGQQAFSLKGYDINDDVVGLQTTAQWSATGGMISQDGVYTAPEEEGVYAVEVLMLVTLNSDEDMHYKPEIDSVIGKATVTVGETAVDEYPSNHMLTGNIPNPFQSGTVISYQINRPGFVRMIIADKKGRLQKQIVNDHHTQGEYEISINTTNWPAGTYFCILSFEGKQSAIKLIKL